jgi:hypothetical protein
VAVAARIDVAKILDDLVYLGMTGTPLAERLCITMAHLRRIEKGERPKGLLIDRVVALWCELTGKPRPYVPMTTSAAKRIPTPSLASDEEREPSFIALQAAFMVWGGKPH